MRITLFILTVLLSACSSSLPIPSENDGRLVTENISVDQLRADRQLYINKCSGCHSLHIPSQYSQHEWNAILPVMTVKSKLSSEEVERIKRYLVHYASENSDEQ